MNKRKASLRGSAIAFGLVIMTVVAIILTSIITFVVGQMKYSMETNGREQAFQIAESGIHFYRWYLAHVVDGRTASQVEAFWSSSSPLGKDIAHPHDHPYEVEYKDPDGAAVGKYSITVTPPEAGSTIVTVTSIGWTYKYPDDKRKLVVRFRRPSWSESAVLANDFMRFGEGTEVYGKIHSNQGIRFDGLAHNVISSSVSTYDDPDHGDGNEFGVHTHVNIPPATGVNNNYRSAEAPPNPVAARSDVFEAGRSFPDPTVDFNGVLGDLNNLKAVAQAGTGKYFSNSGAGQQITLLTDGTFDACPVNAFDASTNVITNYVGVISGATGGFSGTNGTACPTPPTACCAYISCGWVQSSNHNKGKCVSKSNYPIIDNGVIFVENNIWLSGQINNKKITIVAANLSGGSAPSVYIPNDLLYSTYTGNDIIGVIAQQDVEIPSNSDTNLRIDAALLAQQGRVGNQHYGNTKSTITVYGAIATNQRYGFSWTDGTGYQTRNLYYDNSLLYYPPPYFPTGTQYEMDVWEER